MKLLVLGSIYKLTEKHFQKDLIDSFLPESPVSWVAADAVQELKAEKSVCQ